MVIAVIVFLAILIVLAGALYALFLRIPTDNGFSVAIGDTFAFGTAAAAGSLPASACASGDACYTVEISFADSSATTENISFSVEGSGGSPPFASLAVLPQSGTESVVACFANGQWFTTCHSGKPLTSALRLSTSELLVLDTGTPSFPSGWTLVADGTGALRGSTHVDLS